MGTVGDRLTLLITIVAVVIVGAAGYVAMERSVTTNVVSLSPVGIGITILSGLSMVAGVFAWWYLPMARPPHRIPMWNDRYHRKSLRAYRATIYALASGALATALAVMVVVSLLPGFGAPATSTIPGGVVASSPERVGRRGRIVLRIQGGSARTHLYPCQLTRCMRGYAADIAVGTNLDLEISSNWAGSSIVGLVLHGA
jgi:hypothetical protein